MHVHVLWDRVLWPIHPGRSHDPEQIIDQVRRYAQVADDRLVAPLGFGIDDIAFIALQCMAQQFHYLGSIWAATEFAPAGDGVVGPDELDASRRYIDHLLAAQQVDGVPEWLRDNADPERIGRLARAVDWCVRDAEDLVHGNWLLDGALVIRTDAGLLPAPAGLALDGLQVTADRLLALARELPRAADEEPLADLLKAEAEFRFLESTRGLATNVVGPIQTGRSGRLTCVLYPAARRLYAVQVVAGTDPQMTAREVDRAKRRLRWVQPGALVTVEAQPEAIAAITSVDSPLQPAADCDLWVAADVVVRRIVLVDGPWKPRPESRHGAVVLGLNDWCRMAAGIMDDYEEFWAFLDEVAALPGPRRVYGAQAVGLWDAFRRDGVLGHDGTDSEDDPIGPAARWAARGGTNGHEFVLRRLGLPGLREWPFASSLINGCVTVGATTPYRHVTVSVEPSLAIQINGDSVDERTWMMILENAIRGGLTLLAEAVDGVRADAWRAWKAAIPQPMRVTFLSLPRLAGDGIKLAASSDDEMVIGFVIPMLQQADPASVHRQIGEALWCRLIGAFATATAASSANQVINVLGEVETKPAARSAGDAFLAGWASLHTTSMFVRTDGPAQSPPKGIAARVSEAGKARALRDVISRAAGSAAAAAAAVDLTNAAEVREQVMIPAATDLIQERIADYDSASILPIAATAIERVWANRTRADHDRILRQAVGWDELPDLDTATSNNTVTVRVADLLAEAILGAAPGGQRRMDHRDWGILLNLGGVLLELASAQAHLDAGVRNNTADDDPSGRSVPFQAAQFATDVRRHHDRRIAADLLSPADQLATAERDDADTWPYTSWTAVMTEWRDTTPTGSPRWQTATAALAADQALHAELGTSCDEIIAVLAVVGDWPTTNEVATVSVTALTEWVCEWSGLDPAAVRRAIRLLTLTPDAVRHDGLSIGRIEDRGARLSVKPLLPDLATTDTVIVMPRRVSAAARLIVAYINAARPPWPGMTDKVKKAFAEWARQQQRLFEFAGEEAAAGPGRHVIRSLKPEKAARRGIQITGEIDLLVIDTARERVWVIEAKAGNVAIDANRILYDIIDFHGVPASTHPRWTNYRQPRGKNYIAKLLTKTTEINDQIEKLLASEGIPFDDQGPWQVIALMLTPTPVPAAYVPAPQVPFATLDALPSVLDLAQPPAPGPIDPSSHDK
ncbi:hypothetical protein DKT69_34625 [Micromonospora sicca]|uniref:Uncharacterized protein n=1 Tax=Micromonospora sicca TaxID=2202420 RepID=A0A317CZC5_9ACTN|nr:hypothetical protein DKT69_34625 [Micromonospora sp. 4G51]